MTDDPTVPKDQSGRFADAARQLAEMELAMPKPSISIPETGRVVQIGGEVYVQAWVWVPAHRVREMV